VAKDEELQAGIEAAESKVVKEEEADKAAPTSVTKENLIEAKAELTKLKAQQRLLGTRKTTVENQMNTALEDLRNASMNEDYLWEEPEEAGAGGKPAVPNVPTDDVEESFLLRAGGNREKAKRMMRQMGYDTERLYGEQEPDEDDIGGNIVKNVVDSILGGTK